MDSYPIIKIIFSIAMDLFMIRLWMQFVRVDYNHPFTQTIIKFTQPILAPLRRILSPIYKVDTASLLVLFILATLKVMVFIYFKFGQFIFEPAFFYYAVLTLVYNFGDLIFWILIVRAVLSWIAPQASIATILEQLTEPLIQPIRRIIPPIGMIDLSFMVFLFILYGINWLCFKIFAQAWLIAMN